MESLWNEPPGRIPLCWWRRYAPQSCATLRSDAKMQRTSSTTLCRRPWRCWSRRPQFPPLCATRKSGAKPQRSADYLPNSDKKAGQFQKRKGGIGGSRVPAAAVRTDAIRRTHNCKARKCINGEDFVEYWNIQLNLIQPTYHSTTRYTSCST